MHAEIIVQAVVSGLMMGFIYALIAVGLSLIFGVMDLVNFAHGEFLMLAMYGTFFLWSGLGFDPLISLPFVALGLALLGVLTYKFIIKRVYGAPMVAQVFATFGLSVFLSSGAQFLWSGNFRAVKNAWASGNVKVSGIYIGIPELAAAVICILSFSGLYLFLKYTETGLALRATSEDKETAYLMGINGDRMFTLGWALGCALVGVAGAVLASYFYVFPHVGLNFVLIAYVAVALGGFGHILGAFAGGIILGLVESLSATLIAPAYSYVFIFGVYLIIVWIKPRGLMGRF